ncbi:DsbA family oxidoreductase [Desulforamulus aquiferis]|uniref:DsbA family protein n=1 Tax=Desulforamulus aquiferis TaxID=1397668 RepID=A0AAW7ZFP5_9FIRM|nr:DsbA family protein [Desulforamulus aquiferis]MDO7787605.1 DsbA family protein [Desulforamulus aquiferis]
MGNGIVESLAKDYPLNIEWLGYELRPERPQEGELLSRLFPDFDPEAANQRFNKIGAEFNLIFRPVNFLPNTRLALLATEYAKDLGVFKEFHNGVFRAYFTEGRNIGCKEAILEIALSLGMNIKETEAALSNPNYLTRLEQNRQSGIPWQVTGLPTFIINEEKRIVGAQSLASFKRTLEQFL